MLDLLSIISTILAICIDIICIVLSSIVIHHSNKSPYTINNNIYPLFSLSDYELEDYREVTLGTYSLTANNCIDSYDCPTKKIDIKEWKYQTLYTKDVKMSYNTLLEHSVSSKAQCESGYKQCGILNTKGDKLCLKKSQECPINYLKVTSSEINNELDYLDDNDNDDDKSLSYSSFFHIGESYLHYSNKAVDRPIIADLRFAIDEICEGGFEDYCDNYNYEQTHYQLIDKISARDFFNNVTYGNSKIIYESGKQVGWYYREYIGFSGDCFDTNEKVYNKINVVKKLTITFLFCVCITVFANGVGFFCYGYEQKMVFAYYTTALLIKGIFILAAVSISAKAKGLDTCNDLYDERVYRDIDDKKRNHKCLITMIVLTIIGNVIRIALAYIGIHDWDIGGLKEMVKKGCCKKEKKSEEAKRKKSEEAKRKKREETKEEKSEETKKKREETKEDVVLYVVAKKEEDVVICE